MSKSTPAFRWPHAGDCIEATWVDRSPGVEEATHHGSARLDRIETADDMVFVIGVELEMAEEHLDGLIEASESVEEVTDAIALITNGGGGRAARARGSIKLSFNGLRDGVYSWSGSWSGMRGELAGGIRLRPSLVRATEGTNQLLAQFPGEEIASSGDELVLVLDRPDSDAGSWIDGTWHDFETEKPQYSESVWAIELEYEPTSPRLFLNSGIEGFETALDGATAFSDNLRSQIASEIWVTAASLVLAKACSSDGDIPADKEDWRRLLIEESSRRLFPEMQVEEGVEELRRLYRDSPGEALSKLVHASQRSLQMERILTKAIAER